MSGFFISGDLYIKIKLKMAKTTGSSDSKKVSFGTKKRGKAKKSFNKHNKTRARKRYRGQGR